MSMTATATNGASAMGFVLNGTEVQASIDFTTTAFDRRAIILTPSTGNGAKIGGTTPLPMITLVSRNWCRTPYVPLTSMFPGAESLSEGRRKIQRGTDQRITIPPFDAVTGVPALITLASSRLPEVGPSVMRAAMPMPRDYGGADQRRDHDLEVGRPICRKNRGVVHDALQDTKLFQL
jgi:hypothetical protein